MSVRRTLLASILAGLALGSSMLAQGAGIQGQPAGVFTDRAGKQHPWIITKSHSLVWENSAYVPVGGSFSPRYLAEGATEANWTKDAEALGKLKDKGVLDILIDPVISAADVPAAAWQKLLGYLDEQGFRYGISFGAGITTPVSGWAIKPTNYRIDDVRDNVDVSWTVSDADSGYFVFSDRQEATQILHEGSIKVRNGIATAPGRAGLTNGAVGIFYPHKRLPLSREWALPDVWSAFDQYRDRLLTTFREVKFGPGLRFFLDPLARRLGAQGEADHLVPDSAGFRVEWEAFLAKRYASIDDLMNAWGAQDRLIQDHKQAARLVMLNANGRGVPFLLDTGTGKRIECRNEPRALDRYWTDLRDCRNESLVYYMNAAADVLKREVADVPVVYTRTHHHRIFTSTQKLGGYDGLGIAAYGRGSSVVTNGADSVISQVEESARPLWCLVTEMMDTSSPAKQQIGYASQQAMSYDLNWLKDIGAKGFFVHSFQALPEDLYAGFQMVKAPEQLDWLRDYSARLGSIVLNTLPSTLPFPREAAGIVRSGPIGKGAVWWVPSLASGRALSFGSSYAGYTIQMSPPEGDMTVVWSLRGLRKTQLLVNDPRTLKVRRADGGEISYKIDTKKRKGSVVSGTITLMMDETPIIISGADPDILPLEAVQDIFVELDALVEQADADKLGASHWRYELDRAQNNYKHDEPRVAFIQAVNALSGIVGLVQPYTWLEGERAESHTFSEAVAAPAASGGGYLALNTEARPGPSGYGATFKFTVPVEDTYSVWMAGTPGSAAASPFVWIIDAGDPRSSAEAALAGSPYMANQFGWLNMGRATLAKGVHTLTLRVTDVAPGTNRYAFALDSILVTRGAFVPNGTTKPALVSLEEIKGRSGKKPDKRGKGAK